MKSEKAIEILKHETSLTFPDAQYDLATAIKLGMEALIRLQALRSWTHFAINELLPGETTEQ